MVAVARMYGRDLLPLFFLLVAAWWSRRQFYMRGVTYRPMVLPMWKERLFKSVFYFGLLGTLDAALRRSGHLLAHLGISVGPGSERSAALLRLLFLHAPFVFWAATGPLSSTGHVRDDHAWSSSATKSPLWKWLSVHVFKSTRIVLSEEWRSLSIEERNRWTDRHYVIGMHPHGLLPLGAIICGLTWAGTGLRGITASGAELPEPENPGDLLHQRWFRQMKLRAAVASGACSLFPGFYEMFSKLGAFECTKPFVRDRLREGKDVAIFPGGAQESVFAIPGRYVCAVSKHKGFVRLALEEHKDILPMWTFGDEAIVPQADHIPGLVRYLQRILKETIGLLVPPTFGGLPRFPPMTLVTGVPVSLEDLWPKAIGDPVSDAAVDEGHRRYIEAQRKLFDTNKGLVPGGHADGVIEFR